MFGRLASFLLGFLFAGLFILGPVLAGYCFAPRCLFGCVVLAPWMFVPARFALSDVLLFEFAAAR